MKFIKTLLLFLALSSCTNTSDTDVQLESYRFDADFFSVDSSSYEKKIYQWESLHPGLTDYYLRNHISMSYDNDSIRRDYILMFISHPDVVDFQNKISNKFENTDTFTDKLNIVFEKYLTYFPDSSIPKKVIFINSFNTFGIDVFNQNLLIGLDFYLGNSHPAANIWEYLKVRYDEKYMIADAMEYWITSSFISHNSVSNFQEELIFKGKIIYLMSLLTSDEKESILFRFSEENIEWCNLNEQNIWNEIIKLDIMYSKDYNSYATFFSDSPFTKGMPQESPGRLGYWVGYKIIESYMKNNNISLYELMQNTNSQEILLKSKYKP